MRDLESLHLLKHPFYQDWMAGKLTTACLQDYARQYFAHVDAFPRYLGAIHSQCTDATERRTLLENLNDEEGLSHGQSHPELWLNFARGLGVERDQVLSAGRRAAIQKVVDTFFTYARSSYHEGLGALYAYEQQVPEIAESKIAGLKERYGISDPETLSFFEVHRVADVHHRKALKDILDHLPEEQKAEATQAAVHAATVLWDFLTDVHTQENHVSCA